MRFLADENFNRDIVDGVRLRSPDSDLACAQDEGLSGLPDPDVLACAAQHQRVILTHDRRTMPRYAAVRMQGGLRMPGLCVVPMTMSIAQAIEELSLIVDCSRPDDWDGLIRHLPL